MTDDHKENNKIEPPPPERFTTPSAPQLGIWPILVLLLLLAHLFWMLNRRTDDFISYTRFKQELAADNIARLEAEGERLKGRFRKPVTVQTTTLTQTGEATAKEVVDFKTILPPFGDDALTKQIINADVDFVSKGTGGSLMWLVLLNFLPFLLLIGLLIMMTRRTASQAGNIMSIGRSRAKRFEKELTSITFEDVAGADEAKEALQEIITFLKHPQKYTRLGCHVPKGVLLVGPPGTGKTLLARAVAGEAGVPFFSVTGSDFMEMFVGVGASRVRDLFETVKRNTPCIVFLDELDSVGRHRGAGVGGGHDEREQTLNQLLSEIDGFEPTDNLVVIGATNRPDVLDPALLRTGRFDRRITVDLPSLIERVEIMKVHVRRVPLEDDIDLKEIARSMPGRSGADLSNLVNEAALLAASRGKDQVGRTEFSDARDKILMGQLRGGIILSGSEKKAVAVHEAGHALVAHLHPHADPVEKVSILPRGHALGVTQQLPEERYNLTEEFLLARIMVMLSGRASEEVVLHAISTGAADDLVQATRLARRMVGQWGMSKRFTHLAFDESEHEIFLGEQLGRYREYSEATAREIDLEIKQLIDECYEAALKLLRRHCDTLTALAEALEREETLSGAELLKYLNNGRVTPAEMLQVLAGESRNNEDVDPGPNDKDSADGGKI